MKIYMCKYLHIFIFTCTCIPICIYTRPHFIRCPDLCVYKIHSKIHICLIKKPVHTGQRSSSGGGVIVWQGAIHRIIPSSKIHIHIIDALALVLRLDQRDNAPPL